ncbi:hypothetical protein GGX14DRAFT_562681 [Mycena pura]|uniref:Uncharacterized protein n=1 Tax=Mycena pura TaxID=153505 RepID=A0AAD6YI71_9AGAR|nr:hypothetical protein GGX14DRAFT_562681 [Mycena pura]
MSSNSSSGNSAHSHSPLIAPRPAPRPPVDADDSDLSFDSFLIPRISPPEDPLKRLDAREHWGLPHLSDTPLDVTDPHVVRMVEDRNDPLAKCSPCAQFGTECQYSEAGIPCPPCVVLGVPDCEFADPDFFLQNLRHARDAYLHGERVALSKAVQNNQLASSRFAREYGRAEAWFYSCAQGAINRFRINKRATQDVALRGYASLAAACTDPGLLARFITFGYETHIHPIVLHAVADRLLFVFTS